MKGCPSGSALGSENSHSREGNVGLAEVRRFRIARETADAIIRTRVALTGPVDPCSGPGAGQSQLATTGHGRVSARAGGEFVSRSLKKGRHSLVVKGNRIVRKVTAMLFRPWQWIHSRGGVQHRSTAGEKDHLLLIEPAGLLKMGDEATVVVLKILSIGAPQL